MVIQATPTDKLILASTLAGVASVVIMVASVNIEMIREHGVLRDLQIGGVMDVLV